MSRRTFEIGDGILLSYIDKGEGPPLLFVHGFTGTAMKDFAGLIEIYRQEYRVIAPDLRGFGTSRPPNRVLTPDFYQRDADDLAALLDHLACGPVVVLGFSDGAEASLLLAASRPDLVRGVIAWGVCGVVSPEEIASVEKWLPISTWGPERQGWKREIIEWHGEEQLEPLITGWVAAARAIYARGGNISYDQSTQIECPALLLNGDREIGNTPRDARRLAARIPSCRLEFVADCGHAIQTDQPAILNENIRAFLKDLDERSVS
jgi:valacyclovir hydrolase